MPKLLRINEVARLLDITAERAYELARVGVLPTVHLGRQVRVNEDKLMAWIENGGQALPGGWKRTQG